MIWLLIAFAFGLLVKQFGLPPLVGYLAAGFTLHAAGVELDPNIETISDIGITLMLFTIGLKVDVRTLFKADVWGSSLSHTALWLVIVIPLLLMIGTLVSLSYLDIDLSTAALIVFALSFSSTVCAIKVLEDSYEVKSRQGSLAVRILIIQDIIAVLFLVFTTGKVPSLWAVMLFALVIFRPFLNRILNWSGHGELVPLVGLVLAFGGAWLFNLVDMKGDLGALAMGMLIAGLPKSNELYKSLMSFKDLFLIGFFLSIGFTALPTMEMISLALLVTVLLPIKFGLFFLLFTFFSFRVRTAFLSAMLLANFSEFGLIVAGLSVELGWLPEQWLVIIALAAAFSFFISTISYKYAHDMYTNFKHILIKFQRANASKQIRLDQAAEAEVLVVGMGRVGQGAYKELDQEKPGKIWGVEVDAEKAELDRAEGRNVLAGDADDIDFWEHMPLDNVKLIMLAIPSINEMKNIIHQLKYVGYRGSISALAQFEDERLELIQLGADVAFNYYAEVGTGFAEESRYLLR